MITRYHAMLNMLLQKKTQECTPQEKIWQRISRRWNELVIQTTDEQDGGTTFKPKLYKQQT